MTDHRDSKPEETPEPQQLGAPETTPENPQRPEPSTEPSQDQRRALIDADLKSARTLSTVAAIAGPVSFIIGGVMLSTVGLVCAIVGFVKIKHVIDDVDGRQKVYAATVRQTLIWGLAISAIALIVNIVGIALMMPVLMEAMQTGDFTPRSSARAPPSPRSHPAAAAMPGAKHLPYTVKCFKLEGF